MTIEIRTVGEVCGLIMAIVAVLTVFSVAHWKLFAAPIINKVLAPIVDVSSVHQRILRKKHPEEYEKFEIDVKAERAMRGAA